MKLLNTVLMIALLTFQTFVFAEDKEDAKKQAEILLQTMQMERVFERSIAQMLNIQIQQKPELAPFKQVMLDFFKKYMSYESLKLDMINIYAEAFTASELKDINIFYRTSTGIKTIKLLPGLMAKGGQLGARRVRENITELQQMIKAEVQRLKDEENE